MADAPLEWARPSSTVESDTPVVSFEHLQELVRRLSAGLDLPSTLDAVAQAVVDVLGFEVAVVNLTTDSGDLDVVAVAGDEGARATLLGQRGTRSVWDSLLTRAQHWGGLRFIDHRDSIELDLVTWTPDLPVADHPDAWHPLDQLFAPMWSPAAGLIGVLSVDVPRDCRRPGRLQCALLELFAIQAAAAIENARLRTAAIEREKETSVLLARMSTLVASAPVAIVEFDPAGLITLWNPVAEKLFGWRAQEVLGRRNPTIPPETAPESADMQSRLLAGQSILRLETVRQRKDGTRIPVEITTTMLHDETGVMTGGVGVIVDITERRKLEHQLRYAAYHDALTGLPNRGLFDDRVAAAFLRLERSRGALAMLMIDLDGFKRINDTLGHAAGDQLLIAVARRLRTQVRASDTVARLGGDEFVVLVEGDACVAEALAERIIDSFTVPVATVAGDLLVGVSVGIASTPADATLPAELLRLADAAMYAAKADPEASYRIAQIPGRRRVS